MSKVTVKVNRNYKGVEYSVEARVEDFSCIGKVIRAIEKFVDKEVKL